MARLTYVLAVLLVVTAGQAYACSPMFLKWYQNKSARPAADCSFEGGGPHDWTRGEKVSDLGAQRTLQIVLDIHSPQLAIVTQCDTAEQIVVYNPVGEEDSCGFNSEISSKIAPTGPIDLSVGRTLPELSTYLEKNGLAFSPFDPAQFNLVGASVQKRDIPDYFCGCRLHYPDSEGAKQ